MDLESPLKSPSHADSSASSTPSNAATFSAFDETKTHEKMSVKFQNLSDSEGDADLPETVRKHADKNISQKSLARFVVDNSGVTHVPECGVYIVMGHNDKKYCVTLNPETCQCPSLSRCYHIIAVKMFAGLPFDDERKDVSLRSLSKRSKKRSDKKSGRKCRRINDLDILVTPAPDSVTENTRNKTPKSKKKLKFSTPGGLNTFPSPTCEENNTHDNLPFKKKERPPKIKTAEVKLPAKQRKLTLENIAVEPPSPTWVGRLTSRHKEKIENNQPLCSDIINEVQKILQQQFPDIKGLQPTEKTPIWKENESCWMYGLKFNNVMSPAVQIHHNGKFHLVNFVKLDGHIYVLDRMSNGKLTPSLQI